MYLLSAEGYKNSIVHILKVRKTNEIWVSMKDVGSGMGIKNIFDLVLKEIHGTCKTKNLTKEKINEYKTTETEIYKKFSNLSKDELNTKSNKNIYVRSYIMTNIIKHSTGEKKRGIKAIDGFRKKLLIRDSEISKCLEHEVKSKRGIIFVNEKILEEYSFFFLSLFLKKKDKKH